MNIEFAIGSMTFIHSSAEELRPVISDRDEFGNTGIVFSSNNTGEMDGFDRYFVGIPKF